MIEKPTNPLTWVIEAFSVATGIAFVLSGIANGAVFWLAWRLNYFLIASPSDVIMSGFIVLTVMGAALALAAAVVYMLVLVSKFRLLGSKLKGIDYGSWVARTDGRITNIAYTAIVLFLAFTTILIIQVGSSIYGDVMNDISAAKMGQIQSKVSSPIASNTHGARKPFSYATGLQVDGAMDGVAGCDGASVLWMGSSAAILDCSVGVRVVHKLDKMTTRRLTTL